VGDGVFPIARHSFHTGWQFTKAMTLLLTAITVAGIGWVVGVEDNPARVVKVDDQEVKKVQNFIRPFLKEDRFSVAESGSGTVRYKYVMVYNRAGDGLLT
jgi:hypothetical protein